MFCITWFILGTLVCFEGMLCANDDNISAFTGIELMVPLLVLLGLLSIIALVSTALSRTPFQVNQLRVCACVRVDECNCVLCFVMMFGVCVCVCVRVVRWRWYSGSRIRQEPMPYLMSEQRTE